jgi:hypothetical protein
LILVALVISSGCSTQKVDYRVVPAPGDVISLAPLALDQIALLGGNETSRNVTIERSSDGSVVRRFGVTREADAIAPAPAGFYVGLAWPGGGAVEEWSADGHNRRTIPMPSAVIGFAYSARSVWALVHTPTAYAAFAVPKSGTKAGRALPLPAETSSIAYCGLSDPSLAVSERDGRITLVRIRDGASTETNAVGDQPVCSKPDGAMYALVRAGGAGYVAVINLSTLLTVRQTPTSRDAKFLATTPAGGLIVLGKGEAASSLRVYAPGAQELRVRS